jgi:drug/metabolite transporter (DMT)-like permease
MLVAVFCFYLGDNRTKVASNQLVVTQVLLIRTMIGLLILSAVLFCKRKSIQLSVYTDIFLLLASVALFCTILSFAISFNVSKDMTPIYVVSFLWPGFLIVFEWLIGGEAPRKSTAILTPVMYIGVILYFWTPLRSNFSSFISLPMLPAYCTAIGYAAFLALHARTRKDVSGLDKNFGIYSIVALAFLIISVVQLIRDNDLPRFDEDLVFTLLFAGLASFAGLILLLYATALGRAVEIAALDFTVVIYAYIRDMYWDLSSFDPFELAGVIVILAGAAAMTRLAKD